MSDHGPNLGISGESVRRWRRRAQIDAGRVPGMSGSEHAEIRRLKRELAELRRTNVISVRRFGKLSSSSA